MPGIRRRKHLVSCQEAWAPDYNYLHAKLTPYQLSLPLSFAITGITVCNEVSSASDIASAIVTLTLIPQCPRLSSSKIFSYTTACVLGPVCYKLITIVKVKYGYC